MARWYTPHVAKGDDPCARVSVNIGMMRPSAGAGDVAEDEYLDAKRVLQDKSSVELRFVKGDASKSFALGIPCSLTRGTACRRCRAASGRGRGHVARR